MSETSPETSPETVLEEGAGAPLRPPFLKRPKVRKVLTIIASVVGLSLILCLIYVYSVKTGRAEIAAISKKVSKQINSNEGFTIKDKTTCSFSGCETSVAQVFLVPVNQTMSTELSSADDLMPKIEDYPDSLDYLKAMEEYAQLMNDPIGNGIITQGDVEQKSSIEYVDEDGVYIMADSFEKDVQNKTGDKNTWIALLSTWDGEETNEYGPNGNYSLETLGNEEAQSDEIHQAALQALKDSSSNMGKLNKKSVTLEEAINQGYAPIVLVYSVN